VLQASHFDKANLSLNDLNLNFNIYFYHSFISTLVPFKLILTRSIIENAISDFLHPATSLLQPFNINIKTTTNLNLNTILKFNCPTNSSPSPRTPPSNLHPPLPRPPHRMGTTRPLELPQLHPRTNRVSFPPGPTIMAPDLETNSRRRTRGAVPFFCAQFLPRQSGSCAVLTRAESSIGGRQRPKLARGRGAITRPAKSESRLHRNCGTARRSVAAETRTQESDAGALGAM
jgi:hypothetical protein